MVIAIIILSTIIVLQTLLAFIIFAGAVSKLDELKKSQSACLHDIEEQWQEDLDMLNELRTDGKIGWFSIGVLATNESMYTHIRRNESINEED